MIANTTFAQFNYIIDFDSPYSENNHIIIDTVSNLNNIWQIGVPDKTVFDSAYSITHAIVTDTLNPYPVNDTSSFILKHIRPGVFGSNESLQLNFWFKFNSDTLTDYGMVEASIDNGVTWINLMTEDVTYSLHWLEPKPILTGNSDGWEHFSLELNMLTYAIGYSDTLLYKFTFISDNIQTNKDGWMIDNFQLNDWWEGIDEFENSDKVNIYPNPSNGNVTIESSIINLRNLRIEIYNEIGILVLNKELNSNNLRLDLPNGMYFIKLIDDKKIYLKKLMIKK